MEAQTLWLALYTQPHKEYMVRDFLEGEGLTLYLPEIENKIQRGDRRPRRPFLPHYLFLQNPGAEKLTNVRWTPGLRKIVTFGERLALIPDELVQQLRARLESYQEPEKEPFEKGEIVNIISGPFEGMEAVFERRLSGQDRVRVFLEMVNRIQVAVSMDLHDLLPPV